MTHRKKLAIIGGGASATLLLAHLARRTATGALSIDVYDRAGAFGKGIAYATPHLCHLLNVRAANMSALADAPDDFSLWAEQHGYQPSDFVPRKLYGDYLAFHLGQAKSRLDVSFIRGDVSSTRREQGYDVGGSFYNIAVQATGNCVAQRPRIDGTAEAYHDSPWSVDYAALRNLDTIALVGSGLSAVDTILALHAHDYQGDITVISRRALFPAAHIQAAAYPAFLAKAPGTVREAFRQIRDEVRAAQAPWQAVIDSLRPFTNGIWQHWPEKERAVFMKRLFTYWNIHRHRMAPQIAQQIARLEKEGRVRRLAAAVLSVGSQGVLTGTGFLEAGAVINCLGYRYQEGPVEASHRIGPACFGPLFETTAIPEIRAQAAALAAKISL